MTNGIEPLSMTLSPKALRCFEIKMHDSSNLVLSRVVLAVWRSYQIACEFLNSFSFFLSSVYFKLLVIKFNNM